MEQRLKCSECSESLHSNHSFRPDSALLCIRYIRDKKKHISPLSLLLVPTGEAGPIVKRSNILQRSGVPISPWAEWGASSGLYSLFLQRSGPLSISVAIVLLWAWLLTSCMVQQPCLPQTITRDSLVTRYLHDSVYLYERDSIFVQQRADTVYLTRYITRYKDVFQVRHDTIVDTRHEVQVQRERYVPRYYTVVSWGFWIFIVLLLLRIAWWVVKKYVSL